MSGCLYTHPPQGPAPSFNSLYRKHANTPRSFEREPARGERPSLDLDFCENYALGQSTHGKIPGGLSANLPLPDYGRMVRLNEAARRQPEFELSTLLSAPVGRRIS
jgi:hypothetical protein